MLHRIKQSSLVFFAVVLFAASCSHVKNRGSAPVPLASDSLSVEQACRLISAYLPGSSGSPDTAMLGGFYKTLDSASDALRLGAPGTRSALRDSILTLIYGTWKIRFDSVDTATETLLPHCIFRERQGACLGVSLIILMLAEKTGCPIYGVMLPNHFFCRYDDGKDRVNIEPNRSGLYHDDGYYRSRYNVKGMPWYNLANLSTTQAIGILCYNAGTICLHRKQYGPSIEFFRETLRRIPSYGEAKGNMAVAFAKKGKVDTALVLFNELWAAYPDMANLATNYGLVAAAAGRPRTALGVYVSSLERDPTDQVMFRRASHLVARLGDDDSSKKIKKRFEALSSGLDTVNRKTR